MSGRSPRWVKDIKKKGVPSSYTRLEYIQSSGTQRINTGIPASKNLRVEAIMDVTAVSSWIMILGDYTPKKFFSWWASGSTAYAYFGSKSGTMTLPSGKHTYIADGPNKEWKIDSNSISVEPASDDFSTDGDTLCLFTVNNGGSYPSASLKLYRCKIYSGTKLVRDFIPCKTVGGTIGLYEAVQERLYINEGSGTFTAGPEA